MKLTDEKQKFYRPGFLINPSPFADVMIYITSFLNIWEKQVALRLVNKNWYNFFESQEMMTEQKLII